MNKKNITIIIITFIIILGSISLMFYINLKDNKPIEVEATVKLVGNNYIIVEDNNKKEYSINTKSNYKVGDKIDFIIKDIEKNSNPIKGEIVEINLISRDINFQIEDVQPNNETNNKVVETTYTETDVVAYLTNLDNNLTNYSEDSNIEDTLKKGFVTVIDFIFYDGTIKGKTFNELSNETKIKVLELALSIDKKIEKYFPNYKEEISTKSKNIYTNAKNKTIELYLDITTKVCEDNEDMCETFKEGLNDLKENFNITWDNIKKYSKEGTAKLKEWYEVWKEN